MVAGGLGLFALRLEHLRNIRHLAFEREANVVVISGGNGAGKTTVLEAIYLLARGRTFRGRKSGPITTSGESSTWIKGDFRGPAGEAFRMEFRADGAGSRRLLDRKPWPAGEKGRRPISVKLVGENPQALLEGEPGLRRRFLDWNVFHVEPRVGRLRKDFERVLLQRNAVLRARGPQSGWDAAFASMSEDIHSERATFFQAWRSHFLRLSGSFDFLAGCDLRYDRGWSEERSLLESLAKLRGAEAMRGYSLAGPHRADFGVSRRAGSPGFSRGQTKVVVALLQLAAEAVHSANGLAPAIWLLDDLESELEPSVASRLWRLFSRTGGQCFATRVSSTPVPGIFGADEKLALFHVEQGELSDCST